MNDSPAPWPRSSAEVAALFDVIGQETAVLADLSTCVARLQAAQQAKAVLQRLSGAQLRAALEYRRTRRQQPLTSYDDAERQHPHAAPGWEGTNPS